MSEEFIDDSCPYDLEPYEAAYKRRLEDLDLLFYYNGLYTLRAIQVAFSKENNPLEYFEKPITKVIDEEINMTQEERDMREIRKMLAAEEAWRVNDTLRGLPKAQR